MTAGIMPRSAWTGCLMICPMPDICLRYRCSKCDSKNLMSRGSIHEHYEMVDQQRSKARS